MLKNQSIVRFGRTDNSVIKTCFMSSKRQGMQVANNLAYLLWFVHPFKSSDCNQSVRIEQGEFWIEFNPEQGEPT